MGAHRTTIALPEDGDITRPHPTPGEFSDRGLGAGPAARSLAAHPGGEPSIPCAMLLVGLKVNGGIGSSGLSLPARALPAPRERSGTRAARCCGHRQASNVNPTDRCLRGSSLRVQVLGL